MHPKLRVLKPINEEPKELVRILLSTGSQRLRDLCKKQKKTQKRIRISGNRTDLGRTRRDEDERLTLQVLRDEGGEVVRDGFVERVCMNGSHRTHGTVFSLLLQLACRSPKKKKKQKTEISIHVNRRKRAQRRLPPFPPSLPSNPTRTRKNNHPQKEKERKETHKTKHRVSTTNERVQVYG